MNEFLFLKKRISLVFLDSCAKSFWKTEILDRLNECVSDQTKATHIYDIYISTLCQLLHFDYCLYVWQLFL